MKITRIWQRSLALAMLSAGLCTSCASHDAQKGTPTPVHQDGKEGPRPHKGTPTPIVGNDGK